MKNRTFIAIFLGIFLIGIGWIVWRFVPLVPVPSSEQAPTTGVDQWQLFAQPWKTYTSANQLYSLKYPQEMKIQEGQQGRVVDVMYQGPTQKPQTEATDGFGLSIALKPLVNGSSIKKAIEQEAASIKEIGQVTVPVHEVMLAGKQGWEYSAKTLIEYTVIYLPVNTETLLSLSYTTTDPEKKGYKNIVDEMVKSFVFPPSL